MHTTHGQRDEHLLGGATYDVVGRLPLGAGRGDVEEDQLVGALRVVNLRHLHRVAGIAQVPKPDAPHDPADGCTRRVREIAGQSDVTTSALIRRWIEAGIAEDGRDAGDRVVPVEALLELIGRAPREHIDRLRRR